MLPILCFALTVAVIDAGPVNFIDCGNKEVISVDITGCSGDNCVVHKGKHTTIDLKWRVNQDSQTLILKIIAVVSGVPIELKGYDKNGCHYVECPLKKDQIIVQLYGLMVPQTYPNMNMEMIIKANGDHGLLECTKFKLQIAD